MTLLNLCVFFCVNFFLKWQSTTPLIFFQTKPEIQKIFLEKPPPTVISIAVAVERLPRNTANVVVIIPSELRPSLDILLGEKSHPWKAGVVGVHK